jgi:hypothetical protein
MVISKPPYEILEHKVTGKKFLGQPKRETDRLIVMTG